MKKNGGLLTWLKNTDKKNASRVDCGCSTTSSGSTKSSSHRQRKNQNDCESVSSFESAESFTLGVFLQSDKCDSENSTHEDASFGGDRNGGDADSQSDSDSSNASDYSIEISIPVSYTENESNVDSSNTKAKGVASDTPKLGRFATLGTIVPLHGRCNPLLSALRNVGKTEDAACDCDKVCPRKDGEEKAVGSDDEEDDEFSINLVDFQEDEDNKFFVEATDVEDESVTKDNDTAEQKEVSSHPKDGKEVEYNTLRREIKKKSHRAAKREHGKKAKEFVEDDSRREGMKLGSADVSGSFSGSCQKKNDAPGEQQCKMEKPEEGQLQDVCTSLWSSGSLYINV